MTQPTPGMPPPRHDPEPAELRADGATADVFARLAAELHQADSLDETVEEVVQFALHAGAWTYAGVMLTARGRREIGTVTDTLVAEIYRRQIDRGDGPVLTALREGTTVSIPDVATETRWADWGTTLTGYGIGSALHVPMWAADRLLGVLSLYNVKPHAFDVHDEEIAHILARHASVAVATARNDETMSAAVDARMVVGQAMGILLERHDLNAYQAFNVLRRYSQDSNTKLRDVAQHLIDTRRLP
jgi:GAF domain-containing protein